MIGAGVVRCPGNHHYQGPNSLTLNVDTRHPSSPVLTSVLVSIYSVLLPFYGVLLPFYGVLVSIYSVLLSLYSVLVSIYSVLVSLFIVSHHVLQHFGFVDKFNTG
ncbi:hypothetical protein Pmani_028303 [Petrolisthes manimaculis]|uniref:Uncharacterized protein n=1 Tax=Petrolisthes manimaculis TaxID=1843537 RepID=A0AAE1TVL7_9EUCA|nr:hypothetical protein Pmani_028303 [Petrolisthes manimaculis]